MYTFLYGLFEGVNGCAVGVRELPFRFGTREVVEDRCWAVCPCVIREEVFELVEHSHAGPEFGPVFGVCHINDGVYVALSWLYFAVVNRHSVELFLLEAHTHFFWI